MAKAMVCCFLHIQLLQLHKSSAISVAPPYRLSSSAHTLWSSKSSSSPHTSLPEPTKKRIRPGGQSRIQANKTQGLIVVGVDGREEPLTLAKSQKLAPDLAINASKTTPEEALKMIDKFRPEGWTYGSGVDGELSISASYGEHAGVLLRLKPFAHTGLFHCACAMKSHCAIHPLVSPPGSYPFQTSSRSKANIFHLVALVLATNATPAFAYALALLKPFSKIVMTAGNPTLTIPILDLIFKGLTIVGTKNGTGQDLQEATDLCVKFGIESKVRTFKFGQEGMDRLVKEVQESSWAGKAVVVMD
jgi:threonine dehydrogenase-like Zn-dependent dehydrogenase